MELLLVIFLAAILVTFVYAGLRAAPWVPTRAQDVERFLQMADLKPGMTVVDLGCGDGRLIAAAAGRGATATGYEISLLPFLLAQLRRLFSPQRKRIHIRYRDFWKADFRDVDVLYLFLSPKAHTTLGKQFVETLKPGARVIAYVWPIEGWIPLAINEAPGFPKLYLYQKPT